MERSAEIKTTLGSPREEITPVRSSLGDIYRARNDYQRVLAVYQQIARLWNGSSNDSGRTR